MNGFCRLAVLGDPLTFTRSPELHRAGLEALGWSGESSALRTEKALLGARFAELAAGGWRGVNLTHPLKAAAIPFLARVTPAAARARSVNTVGFDADGWWGDTTDGPGFLDLLLALGREPGEQRAVLLGAGGAARSLALALAEAGCEDLCVSAREPGRVAEEWGEIPRARLVEWRGGEEARALAGATLIVNATPLTSGEGPLALDAIVRPTLIVDLAYGESPTPWVERARARGLDACDGLGLLVFQARRSLELWTGMDVPLQPLQRAVGWPR